MGSLSLLHRIFPTQESNPGSPTLQFLESVWQIVTAQWVSQVALVVKNPPANAGVIRDASSILGSGRSPEMQV